MQQELRMQERDVSSVFSGMQVLPSERPHDSLARNVPYRNHSLSRLSPGQILDSSVSSDAGQSRHFLYRRQIRMKSKAGPACSGRSSQ
jgi:hypothetical protein